MADAKTKDRDPEDVRAKPAPKKAEDKRQPLGKAAPEDATEGEGTPGLSIGGGGGHA